MFIFLVFDESVTRASSYPRMHVRRCMHTNRQQPQKGHVGLQLAFEGLKSARIDGVPLGGALIRNGGGTAGRSGAGTAAASGARTEGGSADARRKTAADTTASAASPAGEVTAPTCAAPTCAASAAKLFVGRREKK